VTICTIVLYDECSCRQLVLSERVFIGQVALYTLSTFRFMCMCRFMTIIHHSATLLNKILSCIKEQTLLGHITDCRVCY